MLCTHSPIFIDGNRIEGIRIMRISEEGFSFSKRVVISELVSLLANDSYNISETASIGILPKLHQELQPHINEMFFTPILILVEGLEDLAFIKTHLLLTEKSYDFQKYGCHIVPVNGKNNLIKPLAIAKLLGIPVFLIFDSDSDKKDTQMRFYHEKENLILLKIQNSIPPVQFPPDSIYVDDLIVWTTNFRDEIKKEYSDSEWDDCKNEICNKYENTINLQKNVMFIADLLELLYNKYRVSKVLTDVCNMIMDYAKKHSPTTKS